MVRTSSQSGWIATGTRPRGSWRQGVAYYCYCSAERLRDEREKAEQRGEAWQYDRACLALAPGQIAELEATGAPRAIRFKVRRFDDGV